jgi:cell division protein FtsI (penicillin-binding protein 3)
MEPAPRNRVALLIVAVALAAVAILARLYQLQVARSDDLRAQARRQHEQRIEIEGRRGNITDRHGGFLAISMETYSLFAHPWRVQDPSAAARRLAPVLGASESRIVEKLRSDAPFVWIARRLDAATAQAVRSVGLPVGDNEPFGFKVESKRFYPQGPLAMHVIGFANIDQKGVEGIEQRYDGQLQGDSATYLAVRDGRGGMFLQLVRSPARQPDDVVLTLDVVLQHHVERELDEAMETTGAKAASAVLLDPTTGEILALANRPSIDPNEYGKAAAEQRRNRGVVDMFEPGSIFKVVVGAAALDHGVVTPSDPFHCENGVLSFAGRKIRDSHPYRLLTFREVIEHSSNIGMIKTGRRMSDAVLHDYILRFGFGRKTGIELPGEATGLVTDASRWTPSTHASVSFGHEIAVTAIQMASAVGAVANEGMLVPPRIVLGMRDADGTLHPERSGEPRRVLSSGTARTLADILEGVVEQGTGRKAQVAGYRIAGKTGTAQKVLRGGGYSASEFMASFVGFAPVRSPRIAGIVVLDSPTGSLHTGGLTAAPVFGRILSDALAYLRVPPDDDPLVALEKKRDERAAERDKAERAAAKKLDPKREDSEAGTSDGEPPAVATADGQVPDLRGMSLRAAVSALTSRRYRARAEGRGVVVAQTPAPGTPLPHGEICSVRLSDDGKGRP